MQKTPCFIFIICFWVTTIFAQDQKTIDLSLYDKEVVSVEDSIAKYKRLSREAYRSGNLKAFKNYTDIVLTIAIANGQEETRIRALVNVAIYYQQTDQYEQSLDTYLQAEKRAEILPKDSYIKILIKVNLGNLYIAIGDYEKAILTMNTVIELAKNQEGPEQFYNVAYSIIGNAYLHQKKYQKALHYMKLSKDLAIKRSHSSHLIRSMINISDCYIKLERYEDAILNSKETLELIREKESIESKALAQLTIGAGYIGLKRYQEALEPLLEAKDIGVKGNFLKIQMDAHYYLAQVYEALDDLDNSLKEHKAYTKVREQYLKTLSKAQRLELEKESLVKSEIISKQKESLVFLSKEKQVFIFIGVVLVILLMVSSIVYSNKRRKMAATSVQLHDDKLLLENENEVLKDKLNALAVEIQQQADAKETSAKRIKKSSIPEETQQHYMERILDYMEKEKPFLDHEIKQTDIASNLGISVHLFSEILNVCFQKNFNNFINLYRIDTAKSLIKNPKYKHYKILEIGYEAGFPSKTSFNRVFKNLVGQTPSEFQKKHC
ncbi:tetratricopeptide repeat protein [Aquimarina algicola]|uniref:Tetratricopeptide repeat protein n=1 Tax=Aquimarina algicola TaxID=2589995 RepID=A0A504JBW0_9FLAO|nr:tetratricopeptide repeat protein [Aquimarina algicola]TPN85358.1 tetratricopeptide repeat protein [Aquimarina algicola]